ncbi:methyltransferase domain-containing protein [Actinocorallia libanotica]|uniref:Protein-L-isoaspartate O-methyltransferase n=1 Tax=Actinocorallia libanotica TaxID=46162 RepID=A0ABP4BZD5_9ACTN
MGTTAAEPATEPDVDRLRTAMVARLKEQGSLCSPEIEAAFLAVPRERFAPEADPVEVYRHNEVVVTRRGADGRATSSISAPWLQAEMLAHAALRPAERVLEVGSGGYNAALIAEIVSTQGAVTTVDIDPFVTERARRFLTETGYGDVRVVLADAADLPDALGPFDAIIVTVGVWDAAPAWIDRLVPGGWLVVPLRFGGITRSITFVRDDRGRLLGHHPTVCGFVAAQGGCAHSEQEVSSGRSALPGPSCGRASPLGTASLSTPSICG